MKLRVKRFSTDFPLPQPEPGAACFNFVCRETVTVPPHQMEFVPQNIAYQIPNGYAMLIFARSSTAKRKGLMLANSVGVIDPFFNGDKDENLALVYNFTDEPVTVQAGDKIVQGMLIRSEPVQWQEVDQLGKLGHGGYQHREG